MPAGLPHVSPLLAPGVRELGAAKPAPTDAEIRKAAQEFESLLLNQMIKGLRRTVPEAEPKGHEHQMYQELLDERLAQELAGRGGIGIAEALQRYMRPGIAREATPPVSPRDARPSSEGAR